MLGQLLLHDVFGLQFDLEEVPTKLDNTIKFSYY